jgi:hypothetical protein
MNYLPVLASNHDCPDLCLLSSYDYRCEPLVLPAFLLLLYWGLNPGSSYILGKYSATELHPQSLAWNSSSCCMILPECWYYRLLPQCLVSIAVTCFYPSTLWAVLVIFSGWVLYFCPWLPQTMILLLMPSMDLELDAHTPMLRLLTELGSFIPGWSQTMIITIFAFWVA